MSRPVVEVADILRAQGSRFLNKYQSSFGYQKLKAFRAIQNCRTAALGGHLDACQSCGYQHAISYNSCRNRHCPKCQAQARQRWLAAREREVLQTNYFHVVFSVPHELNIFALENPRAFYDLLFKASAASALEMAANPERLGAEIGMIAILHTWGQNLLLHPHIHCVIPGGGLSPGHERWVNSSSKFFLPVKALRRLFRGKFIAGLKRLYRRKKLGHAGPAAVFSERKQFTKLVGRLRRQDWVVYAKPAFGGPLQVLRYLGRYTHRVAISNHRLQSFDGERVAFRWRDYAHGNKSPIMTLDAVEFLRRFFLHILPKGFVRIRHFGFLANRFRAKSLTLCRQLLAQIVSEPALTPPVDTSEWRCPRCGAKMKVAIRLSALDLACRQGFLDSS
ncbi:MAG: IS91 family transposase [Bryobacteraceae bacterium]